MEPYAHLKTAQELREEGNREFKGGYYDAAAAKYRAALRKDNNWALLHCNLALCFAKQEKWEECVQAATACLAAPSCDAATARKALLHRSRAYRASPHRRAEADLDHARADLERALETDPANKVLRRELAGLLNGEAVTDAALPDAPALQLSLTEAELGRPGRGRAAPRRAARAAPGAARGVGPAAAGRRAARRRAEHDAAPLRKGYDGHAPAFSRPPATAADAAAAARLARAAPARIGARRPPPPGTSSSTGATRRSTCRPGPCGAWRRACTRSRPGSWTTTRGTRTAASCASRPRARAATRGRARRRAVDARLRPELPLRLRGAPGRAAHEGGDRAGEAPAGLPGRADRAGRLRRAGAHARRRAGRVRLRPRVGPRLLRPAPRERRGRPLEGARGGAAEPALPARRRRGVRGRARHARALRRGPGARGARRAAAAAARRVRGGPPRRGRLRRGAPARGRAAGAWRFVAPTAAASEPVEGDAPARKPGREGDARGGRAAA